MLMTLRTRASCSVTEATRVLAIKNSTSTSPWQRAPAEALVLAMTATAHNGEEGCKRARGAAASSTWGCSLEHIGCGVFVSRRADSTRHQR